MKIEIPNDPVRAGALARDPKTPIEILAELAKSDLMFLREDVAHHPNTSPELLMNLLPDTLNSENDRRMATALVTNPITPEPALSKLSQLVTPEMVNGSRRENWAWERLVVELVTHKNCPSMDALALLKSEGLTKKIKTRIAERSSSEHILNTLLTDPSEVVRRAAAASLSKTENY